jgi:hypothetical protein
MQRKRDLTTNEIKLHKARLNLHGRKQIYGMNYFETYAPGVMHANVDQKLLICYPFKSFLR